ncbi:MAG: S-methyl-5'-thioinosine phosphorylase [Pseudomonadota bacterium]
MPKLAIIGGTGLGSVHELQIERREVVRTPYGDPSGPVLHGSLDGVSVVFLARHGFGHTIPPHRVNYRANIWALRQIGAQRIVAVAAVGGIRADLPPGALAIPHQIVDYTWGRDHTFFADNLSHVTHIDFSHPYDAELRNALLEAGKRAGVALSDKATYGATQGPRLETAAEIDRLERDGCDIVGMTGMPEAALAREADVSYATCAVIANEAAGRGPATITMEDIRRNLEAGMSDVRSVLRALAITL